MKLVYKKTQNIINNRWLADEQLNNLEIRLNNQPKKKLSRLSHDSFRKMLLNKKYVFITIQQWNHGFYRIIHWAGSKKLEASQILPAVFKESHQTRTLSKV